LECAAESQWLNGRFANRLATAQDNGDAERRFVRDMLTAAVRNGAIAFNAPNLRGAAVAMLRALWRDVAR
jgi:hypothetical protein